MRLYRLGDCGEQVKDIQDRLSSLGYACGDAAGEFGMSTLGAVIAFQRDRGLDGDGVVGPDAWRALYEAGYRLGDRLLFLRRPMLRGDDVAELQRRLNSLGFDAGKTDGIFGLLTQRAVTEFQRNRCLAEDGIAGPEVITELRLVSRRPVQAGREAVREREWLRSLEASVVGARIYFDPAARTHDEGLRSWEAAAAAALELQERGGVPVLSRSADEVLPERVRARRANRLGADVIVGFQLAEPGEEAVYFFQSPQSRSEAGERMAAEIAAVLEGAVEGRASAILRETRAPAVVVARHDLGAAVGRKTVEGLERFFLAASRL
jgi:N-acetylmuramoyl-L-alanine amidase